MGAVENTGPHDGGDGSCPESLDPFFSADSGKSVEYIFIISPFCAWEIVIGLEPDEGHIGGSGDGRPNAAREQGISNLLSKADVFATILEFAPIFQRLVQSQSDPAVNELPQHS